MQQPKSQQPKPLPDGQMPASNVDEFAAQYGWQVALFREDPDLWKWLNRTFQRYAKNPAAFSSERFAMELQKQPFWQRNTQAFIKDREFELSMPEQWNAAVDRDVETTRDQLVKLGASMDEATLRQMVIAKRRGAYNDAQWQNAVSGYVQMNAGRFAGAAGATQDSLRQWASKNGVSLSDSMLQTYVQRMASGDTTLDDVKADLRNTYLVGAYPAWSEKIQQGYDPADLFAPYMQSAKQLLENDNITLDDPIMQRITQAVGADGKPSMVPLYEAQRLIRSDDRWQYTNNARATYAQAGEDILRMFGFR